MVRWLVIALAVFVAVTVLGGSAVLASVRGLPERAAGVVSGGDEHAQSAAQISATEFVSVQYGDTKERVRGLLGQPETESSAVVEGVEIECWAYGISGASGAFQLCFADGRLSSRFRYG